MASWENLPEVQHCKHMGETVVLGATELQACSLTRRHRGQQCWRAGWHRGVPPVGASTLRLAFILGHKHHHFHTPASDKDEPGAIL